MFNHAVARQSLPKHVSTDHDPLFRCHRRLANRRVLEIDEIKSVPYAPVSQAWNGYRPVLIASGTIDPSRFPRHAA
jgi:hypothetical protein